MGLLKAYKAVEGIKGMTWYRYLLLRLVSLYVLKMGYATTWHISRHEGFSDSGNLWRQLNKLEVLGYIERCKSNNPFKSDRLVLSHKGKLLLTKIDHFTQTPDKTIPDKNDEWAEFLES